MSQKPHSFWYHLLDVLFNIVVIVGIVAAIRTFLVSPFQVEGSSMVDTLEDRQYIIINKLAYIIGHPDRGEVVVFHPPNDHDKYYVKRVIGLPGDTVVVRGGNVYLKKAGEEEVHQLEEPYLNDRNRNKTYRHPPASGDTTEVTYTVPSGHYFVLGDNRQGSLDSRSFANEGAEKTSFVTESDIKGRVWFIALPITKIHALEAPQYGF